MIWIILVVSAIISCEVEGQEEFCNNDDDFRCFTGMCINKVFQCDGLKDCEDGSDESNSTCADLCNKDGFWCATGNCIKKVLQCDGLKDCEDGSDEDNSICAGETNTTTMEDTASGKTNTTTTEDVASGETNTTTTEDVASGETNTTTAEDTARRKTNDAAGEGAASGKTKAAAGEDAASGKTNAATAEDAASVLEVSSTTEEPNNVIIGTTEKAVNGRCDNDEFQCFNGTCIDIESRCDGLRDCKDGSDEADHLCANPCNHKTQFQCFSGRCISKVFQCDGVRDCEDAEDEDRYTCADCYLRFKCPSGKCVPLVYVCDGDNDCPDGADEKEAECLKLPCERYEFKCQSGECLWREWQCDGEKDCEDGSDEDPEVCEAATINFFELDDTDHYLVTIKCEVIGFPLPKVIWKKDGEPIIIKDVVNTTKIDNRIYSVLTLPRTAFVYHQYTCEGINNAGSDARNVTVLYNGSHPPVSLENKLMNLYEDLRKLKEEQRNNAKEVKESLETLIKSLS